MVIHNFICDTCGMVVEDINTNIVHICPVCGEEMRWDLDGCGIASGDYEHISDSLAMHPTQIAEHNQKFPGIDVMPDGRPRFTSVKQQSDYLDKIGMVKMTQKIRKITKK